MNFAVIARAFASHLIAITRGELVNVSTNMNAPTRQTPKKRIVSDMRSGKKGKVLKRMKKALMCWIGPDKNSAGPAIWMDIPETEADRELLEKRKEQMKNNPIAFDMLKQLHGLGFVWMYTACPNQYDGFSEDDCECCDCTAEMSE